MIFGKKEGEKEAPKKQNEACDKKVNITEIKDIAKKLDECEPSNSLKKVTFIILILSILILIVSSYILYVVKYSDHNKILTCGDGTPYDSCSVKKPYFCLNGVLMEEVINCGCPSIFIKEEGKCISKYMINPKNISLKYILRGEENSIDFIVYGNMSNYLSNLPDVIYYGLGETPSRRDFKMRNLDEQEQKEFLLPLVIEIQNRAKTKEDQMRIAVSLVQNIPYGLSNKTIGFGNNQVSYSRYPYETLYEVEGICGEKSELLIFLLREIGYETVFFFHHQENHESVGIKCPEKYSLDDSGYCFVETTGPAIITDSEIEYSIGVKLISHPEIITISNGLSLKDDLYEYDDAKAWAKIRENDVGILNNGKFRKLREKYGLVTYYSI